MRNLRRLTAFALLLVGVAGFAHWAWTRYAGQVFDVPVSEAHRILQKTGLPPQVLGSQEPKFEVQAEGPARIVWTVKMDGKDAMRFIADLSSAGAKSTRVHVSVAGPASGPMSYIATRLTERRTIKNLYVMAMEEQVAAALQQREFRMTAIYPAMFIATFANIGDLNKMQERDNEATRNRYRDNLAKAYADEAAAAGRTP